MIGYIFRKATQEEVSQVFDLYIRRVKWMDTKGIELWNTTGYLDRYPLSYYQEQCSLGRLYVIAAKQIIGAVVLYETDNRWPGKEADCAYYIHNLVTDPDCEGAGSIMMEEIESLAISEEKNYLRLDCKVDNQFLNNFYESRGYHTAGECSDGPYHGVLREKRLQGHDPE